MIQIPCRLSPSVSRILHAISVLTFIATARAQNLAGDEALSKVLIDGEGWQLVADGLGFTDAACADAEGNFYFSRRTSAFKCSTRQGVWAA
jgi:hypothetical protein